MQPISFRTRLFLYAAVLLIGLLSAGCQRQSQALPPPPAPEVATVTVRPQKVLLTTQLAGRTSAFRVAEIRPQVNGLVRKRLFTEGTDVAAGDVLYHVDPASFEAALNNAKAALGRSEANLPAIRSRVERYGQLLAEKAVSQQDYDDADAALKLAEADIAYWKANAETARINLAYTRITAPISGRIGRSAITEGSIVTAYQPMALATIQQLDPIYVDVPQSANALLRLKQRLAQGQLNQNGNNQNKVRLLLEDGTVYPLQGTLQFRDITVDPTTGSVTLRVVFPNPDGVLLPGMFVRAVIKEGVNERAILIPQQAVSRDQKGNPAALVVDAEDKVRQRMLALDQAVGDQWLVSSGLSQGDRLIVEGIQKVRPGAAVRVIALGAGGHAGDAKLGNRAAPAPKSN